MNEGGVCIKMLPWKQLTTRGIGPVLLLTVIILAFACVIPVHAGNASLNTGSKERIHISSETLVVDSEAKYAEFTGNVRAVQGDTVIRAGNLRILYRDMGNKKKSAQSEESIEKIVATGNVRIEFDDKLAETDQAVYTTSDRILVLSGSDSRITMGMSSVSGSKIIFHRNEGRIKVESNGGKPVTADVYPGEKGID